jgi:hypothetical protein
MKMHATVSKAPTSVRISIKTFSLNSTSIALREPAHFFERASMRFAGYRKAVKVSLFILIRFPLRDIPCVSTRQGMLSLPILLEVPVKPSWNPNDGQGFFP